LAELTDARDCAALMLSWRSSTGVSPSTAASYAARSAARLISSECRLDSALVGSISASSSPAWTCCPALTYSFFSVPLLAKLTPTLLAGESVPLPEIVDCTTPRFTVVVRVLSPLEGDAAPTAVQAITIAATHSASSTPLSSGCSRKRFTIDAMW